MTGSPETPRTAFRGPMPESVGSFLESRLATRAVRAEPAMAQNGSGLEEER